MAVVGVGLLDEDAGAPDVAVAAFAEAAVVAADVAPLAVDAGFDAVVVLGVACCAIAPTETATESRKATPMAP